MINKHVLKVKDHPTLYRDPNSKAILVVDQAARQNYINQKTLAQNSVKSTEKLQQDMDEMKQELVELKGLLRSLLNK